MRRLPVAAIQWQQSACRQTAACHIGESASVSWDFESVDARSEPISQ